MSRNRFKKQDFIEKRNLLLVFINMYLYRMNVINIF